MQMWDIAADCPAYRPTVTGMSCPSWDTTSYLQFLIKQLFNRTHLWARQGGRAGFMFERFEEKPDIIKVWRDKRHTSDYSAILNIKYQIIRITCANGFDHVKIFQLVIHYLVLSV